MLVALCFMANWNVQKYIWIENIRRTSLFEFLDQKFGPNKEKSNVEISVRKYVNFII